MHLQRQEKHQTHSGQLPSCADGPPSPAAWPAHTAANKIHTTIQNFYGILYKKQLSSLSPQAQNLLCICMNGFQLAWQSNLQPFIIAVFWFHLTRMPAVLCLTESTTPQANQRKEEMTLLGNSIERSIRCPRVWPRLPVPLQPCCTDLRQSGKQHAIHGCQA